MTEQAYFWSPSWQADERESLAELAAGRGVAFDSAEDALSWLVQDDEDASQAAPAETPPVP